MIPLKNSDLMISGTLHTEAGRPFRDVVSVAPRARISSRAGALGPRCGAQSWHGAVVVVSFLAWLRRLPHWLTPCGCRTGCWWSRPDGPGWPFGNQRALLFLHGAKPLVSVVRGIIRFHRIDVDLCLDAASAVIYALGLEFGTCHPIPAAGPACGLSGVRNARPALGGCPGPICCLAV